MHVTDSALPLAVCFLMILNLFSSSLGFSFSAFNLKPYLRVEVNRSIIFRGFDDGSRKLPRRNNAIGLLEFSYDNSGEICANDVLSLLAGCDGKGKLSKKRIANLLSSIKPMAPICIEYLKENRGMDLNYCRLLPYIRWSRGTEASSESTSIKLLRLKSDFYLLGNRDYFQREKVYNLRRSLRAVSPLKTQLRKAQNHPPSLRGNDAIVQKILFPPKSVLSLCATVKKVGKSSILRMLKQERYNLPDVQNSTSSKCSLGRYDYGRRFVDSDLNNYFSFLFEAIARLAPSLGFNISLTRYDLFHAHLFVTSPSNRIGLLFHAREYPRLSQDFPYNLGFCQTGSNVDYDASMNFRNILWLAPEIGPCESPRNNGKEAVRIKSPGALLVLDATPGTVVFEEMVFDGLEEFRTIYEGLFGDVLFDVNYFGTLSALPSEERLFIC